MTTFRKKLKGFLSAWLVVAILAISVVPGVTMPTVYAATTGSCGPDATYTISGAQLTITGTGAINASAFIERNDIQNIIIREGITSIGSSAFSGCQSLNQVSIPSSVTEVGSSAFSRCQNLSLLIFNGTVEPSGPSGVFSLCNNLSGALVPADYETDTFLGLPVKRSYKFSSHPQNATAQSGGTATFSVTVAGTGLTYKWQYLPVGGSTWTDCGTGCTNANTATMTVTADYNTSYNTDGTRYRCVVTPPSSSAITSNAAILTVTNPVQTAPAVGEGFTIDYANETITIASGYEAFSDSAATTAIASGSTVTPGSKVYIRKAASGTMLASASTANSIAARPAAPSGLIIGSETIKGKNDGSILTLTTDMEYKIDTGDWTSVSSASLTNLAAGTVVTLRYKATATEFASAKVSYTIDEGSALSVSFNLNGGEGTTPAAQTGLSYNALVTAPATTGITKAGYKLLGWSTSSSATTSNWDFAVNKITESITLYAVWQEKTTVAEANIDTQGTITAEGTLLAGNYDGSAKSFTFTNNLGLDPASFDVKYVYAGLTTYSATPTYVTPKDAGYYDVVITRAEDDNYKAFSKTIENGLYIAPKVVEIEWSNTVHTYDGTAKTVSATVTNAVGSDVVNLILSDNSKTAAGNYTANVTGIDNPNYTIDGAANLSQAWSIAPRPVTISWNYSAPFEYDGTEKTVTAQVELGSGMAPVEPVVENNKQTNASDYNATVTSLTGEGAANYTLSGATGVSLDWTIAPRPISVVWSNYSGLVYTGAPQTIVAEVSNKVGSDVVNLSLAGHSATNKGDYNATITAVDNANYTITGATGLSQTWSIAPKALDSSAIQPVGDHEFTGSTITPAVSVKDGIINLVRGTDFNIVSYNNNKNIGRATFEVEFIGNYSGHGTGSFSIIDTMAGGIVFTVTFDSNGGSKVDEKRVHRLQRLEKPENPERDGFVFSGWYIDNKFTEKYDFEKSVMDHLTLYAKWTAEKSEEEIQDEKPVTPPSESTAWKNPFIDVVGGDWFYDDVKFANRNGIMNGTSENKFSPNEAITRAMMVTVLYRNEGSPEVSGTSKFDDVLAGSYYEKAVIWAEKYGIVKGYSDTEFGPDDNILREQISAIMFRYAKYKGYETKSAELSAYTDASDISGYAVDAMKYAVGAGLMKGKSATLLKPLDTATRAEIAAILRRFINTNK